MDNSVFNCSHQEIAQSGRARDQSGRSASPPTLRSSSAEASKQISFRRSASAATKGAGAARGATEGESKAAASAAAAAAARAEAVATRAWTSATVAASPARRGRRRPARRRPTRWRGEDIWRRPATARQRERPRWSEPGTPRRLPRSAVSAPIEPRPSPPATPSAPRLQPRFAGFARLAKAQAIPGRWVSARAPLRPLAAAKAAGSAKLATAAAAGHQRKPFDLAIGRPLWIVRVNAADEDDSIVRKRQHAAPSP